MDTLISASKHIKIQWLIIYNVYKWIPLQHISHTKSCQRNIWKYAFSHHIKQRSVTLPSATRISVMIDKMHTRRDPRRAEGDWSLFVFMHRMLVSMMSADVNFRYLKSIFFANRKQNFSKPRKILAILSNIFFTISSKC